MNTSPAITLALKSKANNENRVNSKPRTHLLRLDVLRGVAILIVFIFHFAGAVFGWDFYKWNGAWRSFNVPNSKVSFIYYPLTLGWTGVSLFFVISGFVIHLSCLNSKKFNLKEFYSKRFWRVYPAYLIALFCFTFLQHIDILSKKGVVQFVSHAMLIHNFHPATFFAINSSFWSLALEVQFYLLYPVILLIRKKIGIKKTLLSTLALSIVSRLILLSFQDCSYPITPIWTFPTILWFDWVIGAYLAEKFYNGEKAFSISKGSLAALTFLFLLSTLHKFSNAFSFSIASVISGVIIDKYVHNRKNLSKLEQLIVPVGLCSYSLYLWHQPIIIPLFSAIKSVIRAENNLYLSSFAVVICSGMILFFSWLLYILIEKNSLLVQGAVKRIFRK